VLGGLGLPVPEEAPIILAGVLSHRGRMYWPLALGASFLGVLVGDFLVYFLGFWHGERVLSWRLTRRFLTLQREAQIKGYFHRHGVKILILSRFAPGFRTAAYLTAGILRLPTIKLLAADSVAAALSTSLMFSAGYFFTKWIEQSLEEMKRYAIVLLAAAVGGFLLYRYIKARLRAGLPVGPPVPVTDEVPIPPDDLAAEAAEARLESVEEPPAPPVPSVKPDDLPANR
jgi:membrane protein DedA with SNARE-associated domain